MDNTPTPTPGFAFPTAAQDKVEALLRASAEQPVRSVRPDRQRPLVVLDEPKQAAVTTGPQAGMVPVTEAPPTPIPTAEYVSISLPSRFAYYSFKDLYVKPFRIPHLAKLAKSDASASMQIVAETVGSVLLAPGVENPVMQLSVSDLNAVMAWLRLNSFTQKTVLVTSECKSQAHLHKVKTGALPKETLKVHTRVDSTTMVTQYLDEMPDPEKYCIRLDDAVIRLRPETVKESIEFLDNPNWADPEFQYLARLASVMDLAGARPDFPWTLDDKIKFLNEELAPEHAALISEFCDMIARHGIVETIATKCAECGASGSALLTFDARTFLSPSF